MGPAMKNEAKPVTTQGWQQKIISEYCEAWNMTQGMMICEKADGAVIETMVNRAGLTDSEFSEAICIGLASSLLTKLSPGSDMEFHLPIGSIHLQRNDKAAGVIAGSLGAQVEAIKTAKANTDS